MAYYRTMDVVWRAMTGGGISARSLGGSAMIVSEGPSGSRIERFRVPHLRFRSFPEGDLFLRKRLSRSEWDSVRKSRWR